MNNQVVPKFSSDDDLDLALTDWVAHQTSFKVEPPTEAFLNRARQVARRAESIRQLSDSVIEMGYKSLPLPDYLAMAARAARVNLGRLLSPVAQSQSDSLPWVQLANAIGMPGDFVKILIRLWIANRYSLNEDYSPVLARHYSGGREEPDCESLADLQMDEVSTLRMLEELEAGYDDKTNELLVRCLAEVELG